VKIRIGILSALERFKLSQDQLFYSLTLLIGVLSGCMAIILHYCVGAFSSFLGTDRAFEGQTFFWGGLSLIIAAFITFKLFPFTSGSGIPSVRVALAVSHGRISWRDWSAKFFASLFSLSSGLSMGREGPTVTICSGIGSSLGRLFSLPKEKVKTLCAVGSSAGIAAAFNTPIAAVIFTLEEILGDLNTRKKLGPIVISSVIASVTALTLVGDKTVFPQVKYELGSPFELIIYLGIGIVAAFLGPLWVTSILKLREVNKTWFSNKKLVYILLVFVVIGGMSMVSPAVLGSGHMTVSQTLLGEIPYTRVLLLLLVMKLIATTLSYSTGLSGGLFMPTLFIGAMVGGVVATAIQGLGFESLAIGSCALVGMGAFFAAVIRAPFTSILMIFEMTRDYEIILPLMIANITAFGLSKRLKKGSVYENLSEQDGIHLPGSEEDNEILSSLLI
jgi:CIC family chloride channel protein